MIRVVPRIPIGVNRIKANPLPTAIIVLWPLLPYIFSHMFPIDIFVYLSPVLINEVLKLSNVDHPALFFINIEFDASGGFPFNIICLWICLS